MRVPDRKPKGVPNRAGNVPPRAAAGTLGALCFTAALLAPAAAGSALAATRPAAAAPALSVPLLTSTTSKSFSAAVSSLKTAVSSAGMMVLGELNQAGALSVAGLHLKGAESFFVGNPVVGKKFFQMNAIAGIEIPVGFYLWVDKAGKTEIGYFAPTPVLSGASAQLASGGPMFSKMAAKIADATA